MTHQRPAMKKTTQKIDSTQASASEAVRKKSQPQPEPKLAKATVVVAKARSAPPPTPVRKAVANAPPAKAVAPKSVVAAKAGAGRQEKNEYYELLLATRGQLVSQVRNLSSATLASTKQAGEELADIGSDNFSREIGLAMMTEDGRKLAQVQEALERLSSGTYGVCTDCGKNIAGARLKAIPYAKLCVDCQGLRELQEKNSKNGIDDDSMFGENAENDAPESATRDEEKEEEEDEAGEEEDDAEA